jgi:hypothetical protein
MRTRMICSTVRNKAYIRDKFQRSQMGDVSRLVQRGLELKKGGRIASFKVRSHRIMVSLEAGRYIRMLAGKVPAMPVIPAGPVVLAALVVQATTVVPAAPVILAVLVNSAAPVVSAPLVIPAALVIPVVPFALSAPVVLAASVIFPSSGHIDHSGCINRSGWCRVRRMSHRHIKLKFS